MFVEVKFSLVITEAQISALSEILGRQATAEDANNFFWAEGMIGGLKKLDAAFADTSDRELGDFHGPQRR